MSLDSSPTVRGAKPLAGSTMVDVRLWMCSLFGNDWVEIQMATDQAQQDCALAALAGAVRGAMLCTQAQQCKKISVLETQGWVWVMCDVAYGAF